MDLNREEQWLLVEGFSGEKSEAFFAALARLQAGEPLGYLIGSIPFLNCTIYLDSKPLIPRTETEFWVEKAIAKIKSMNLAAPKILDLCAGSGCIGVAVSKSLPPATVDFSEIDESHTQTIEKNLVSNNCSVNKIIASNLFASVQDKYDFILSNPPYIDPSLDRAEKSVADFEPHLALYGGRDGLELINQIIIDAPAHLTVNGQLWLEHEPEQSLIIKEIAAENNFTCITKKDQYDIERYSILMLQ